MNNSFKKAGIEANNIIALWRTKPLPISKRIVLVIPRYVNPLMPCCNKRSYILKQTCSSKLQVCLSMCDLLLQQGNKASRDSILVNLNHQSLPAIRCWKLAIETLGQGVEIRSKLTTKTSERRQDVVLVSLLLILSSKCRLKLIFPGLTRQKMTIIKELKG